NPVYYVLCLNVYLLIYSLFFFLMILRPPRSTLLPTRRSSDLLFVNSNENPSSHTVCLIRSIIVWQYPLGLGVSSSVSSMSITPRDRKSTRLNSSHVKISYAVFCLKKKNVHA